MASEQERSRAAPKGRTGGAPATTWPPLDYPRWRESGAALHLFAQIVGKYRLAHTPWAPHSWHATLYVTPRGLSTGPVPDPGGSVTLTLDLCAHALVAESASTTASFALGPGSVARFHARARELIAGVGGTPDFHHRPNELPDPVTPFAEDTAERPWEREEIERFHAALVSIDEVFARFRTGFLGKSSPSHLFWGSFDLAVTRFSGRRAPPHPGGIPNLPDAVTREAYSHELASAGFWAGGGGVEEAMFYAYAYPVPDGFAERPIEPAAARHDASLGEFVLPYAAVRAADDPAAELTRFLQSGYEAAATLAGWDRGTLERAPGRAGVCPDIEHPS